MSEPGNFERIYRHGDVILFKLPEDVGVAEGRTARPVDQLVLAYGEATGHAHRLRGKVEVLEEPASRGRPVDNEDEILFRVLEGATLTHEEHDRMLLEPGLYFKVNQVEYDPWRDLISPVRD